MFVLAALFALSLPMQIAAVAGTTTTTWDCCKPACGWSSNVGVGSGPVRSCSASNTPLNDTNSKNACDGGTAFSCSSFAPIVVDDKMSYGFAGHGNSARETCCKCYRLTWTAGPALGKSMIVQAVNTGGDLGATQFDIYTPGGGCGLFCACQEQYGSPPNGWGRQYGGVQSKAECDMLPESIRQGCYWRFDWAGGEFNTKGVDFEEVDCPSQLTSISGCTP